MSEEIKQQNTENKTSKTNKTPDGRKAFSPSGVSATSFFRKKRGCVFCSKDAEVIDYKNVDALKKCTSELGRILPSKFTGTCSKHQRQVKLAVKNARMIGLMSF